MDPDLRAARLLLQDHPALGTRLLSVLPNGKPSAPMMEELPPPAEGWRNRVGLIIVSRPNEEQRVTDYLVGTAWSLGGRRMITAGHVVPWFLPPGLRMNKVTQFHNGFGVGPFPGRVEFGPDKSRSIPIAKWICGAKLDLAIFDLEEDAPCTRPAIGGTAGASLCVLGFPLAYPVLEPVARTIFLPSNLGQLHASEGGFEVAAQDRYFCHDASTIPGFSGGPVVDLVTGAAVGLHVWGRFGGSPGQNTAVDLNAVADFPWLAEVMKGGVPDPKALGIAHEGFGAESLPEPGVGHEEAAALTAVFQKTWPVPAPVPLNLGVTVDRPDDRDRAYVPSLQAPKARLLPQKAHHIGDQAKEGSCAAFALAAAIEIQLARSGRRKKGPGFTASVRMLDRMAREYDEWVEDGSDGTSLRATIKGFFHNGVCLETSCPYQAGDTDFHLSRNMAREARNITLGAYFRVMPSISDMQMAVQEAGAVIVSARLHGGWRKPGQKVKVIKLEEAAAESQEAHAFVVTGYTPAGFIVQNSWGPGWGGWEGRPGHAIWTYADWDANVLDAWVIRLSARAPDAFDLAGPIRGRLPRPRRITLLGHLAHVERDALVESGTLALGRRGIAETAAYLDSDRAGKRYKRLMILFPDPLLDPNTILSLAMVMTPRLKALGIYPFHVIYGLDEMKTLNLRLTHDAQLVAERFVTAGLARSQYLERVLAPVARVMLESFRQGAVSAAQGALQEALAPLLLVAARPKEPLPVRLVSFGAGSVALCAARTILRLKTTPAYMVAPLGEVPADATARWLGQTGIEATLPGYSGNSLDLLAKATQKTGIRRDDGEGASLEELMLRREMVQALADWS